MNRYDWLLWAFRLFFDSGLMQDVKKMVESLEANPKSGEQKRNFVEETFKPVIGKFNVYLLRALVEVLLGQIRARS